MYAGAYLCFLLTKVYKTAEMFGNGVEKAIYSPFLLYFPP